MTLQIGETHKGENYTIHRSFGKVTFALADIVDRGAINSSLYGAGDDATIPIDSLIYDCDCKSYDFSASTTSNYMYIDTQHMYHAGLIYIIVNEHVIVDNSKTGVIFEGLIDKLMALIDGIVADHRAMLELVDEVFDEMGEI